MIAANATDSDIRIYQFHRWLNPFAKQRAAMMVPMEPDVIEAAVRPHLFSFRWSHLPYHGLYGSIRPWGFILTRSMFQQPALTVRYAAQQDGTRLDLTLGRSLRGILGWGWGRIVAPVLAFEYLTRLFSLNILGPPRWIDVDALWQPETQLLLDQPAVWFLMVVVFTGQFVNAIKSSYLKRNDLDLGYYMLELSDILGMHEKSESLDE